MSLKSRVAKIEEMAGVSDFEWPKILVLCGAPHNGEPQRPGSAWIGKGPQFGETISAEEGETYEDFLARIEEYAFGDGGAV